MKAKGRMTTELYGCIGSVEVHILFLIWACTFTVFPSFSLRMVRSEDK